MLISLLKEVVGTITFTADSRWVISGSYDKSVRIWDTETGQYQVILRGHRDAVTGVSASPEGDYIATAGRDNRLIIWSLEEL